MGEIYLQRGNHFRKIPIANDGMGFRIKLHLNLFKKIFICICACVCLPVLLDAGRVLEQVTGSCKLSEVGAGN